MRSLIKRIFTSGIFEDVSETSHGECEFDSVLFRKIDNSLFYKCKFIGCVIEEISRSTFVECEFEDCSFLGAKLTEVVFMKSLLFDNSFGYSVLNSCDFESSEIGFNGYVEIDLSNCTGLILSEKVDSKNNKLVFDRALGRVYHKLFSGKYLEVLNFIRSTDFIEEKYKQELEELVLEEYRGYEFY